MDVHIRTVIAFSSGCLGISQAVVPYTAVLTREVPNPRALGLIELSYHELTSVPQSNNTVISLPPKLYIQNLNSILSSG
jgi:hypothetical protein